MEKEKIKKNVQNIKEKKWIKRIKKILCMKESEKIEKGIK